MNLDWGCPYPSKRSPVFAKNLVATSQPLAVQAGINALRKGGNAVDAALATAITLTVVEPCSNGIGSDAFAIVWDGSELHGLNASGRSPAALSAERFVGMTEMPGRGWDSVTVPGAVSAWVELSSRFGRLAFGQLFEDAIHHATSGFQVGPKTGCPGYTPSTSFPSVTTATPFTSTCSIPAENCMESRYVALSMISSGSKIVRSASAPI